MTPTRSERTAFLHETRRTSEHRYDTIFATTYDRDDPPSSATHLRFVSDLIAQTPMGGTVLDAPCGTGKYFAPILAAGRNVIGCDQSAGMLAQASAKFPNVELHKVALQDLDFAAAFDAAMCIDAMEDVSPEEWPLVLSKFRRALRRGGHLYLTVEMTDEVWLREAFAKAVTRGLPVVANEDVTRGDGYHYYPPLAQVRDWLTAGGFTLVDEAHSDGAHPSYSYQHFHARA
jgi:SAM-dependent methyltransferase